MAQLQNEKAMKQFVRQCLVGGVRSWPLGREPDDLADFLSLTGEMEVQPILYSMLVSSGMERLWPAEIVRCLRDVNRAHYVGFEYRVEEIGRVFSRLTECGVQGVLLKGVPFSYTIYPLPHHRPSSDVDVLIDRKDLEGVTENMLQMGYREVPDMLFGTVSQQKQFWREGERGFEHVFEFHTEMNNRPLLAPFGMRHFESRSDSFTVGGIKLQRPKAPEAFVSAALHRFGHLPNDRRFLWLYDLKLLADRMSEEEWETVIRLAQASKCRSLICETLRELELTFEYEIPRPVSLWCERSREEKGEISAYYLKENRTRRSDLWIAIRTLPGLSLRLRALIQLVLPARSYMEAQFSEEGTKNLWLLYGKRFWRMFLS